MKKFILNVNLMRHFKRVDGLDGNVNYVTDHEGMQAFADDVQEVVDSRDLGQRIEDVKGEINKIIRDHSTVSRILIEVDRTGAFNETRVDFNA